jgi:hypothetical protein
VTRERLRECINRLDAAGREARKTFTVVRRLYNVAGPHHLWHIDGCHKLIHFGLVVHGGIDGFSRSIMFLRYSDDNRKETMMGAFLEGVASFCVPSRVRADHGGENIEVCRFMLERRGLGRSSFITGRSVHNQRIERLWRDSTSNVLNFYKVCFLELEEFRGIDFGRPALRFIIHHLFLPHINADLQRFIASWANHRISSTQGNRTPQQLLLLNQGTAASQPPQQIDEQSYGAEDGEAGAAEEDQQELTTPQVELEPVLVPLGPAKLVDFRSQVPPFALQDARETFLPRIRHACQVLNSLLQ